MARQVDLQALHPDRASLQELAILLYSRGLPDADGIP